MASPTTFTLQELTGQKRTLQLQGRALPYRGLKFKGTMRSESTWYPGNPIGTLQLLGAQEEPTTVNGQWKDKFLRPTTDDGQVVQPSAIALLNGEQVADVFTLTQVVDSIRMQGQLLRVTWDQFVRDGILSEFEVDLERIEDVAWTMMFTWISRGEDQPPVTVALQADRQGLEADLTGGYQDFLDVRQVPGFSLAAEFAKKLDAAADKIETAIEDVRGATVQIIQNGLSPVNAARRTLAALQEVRDAATEIIDLAGNRVTRTVMSLAIEATDFEDTLVAEFFTRQLRQKARALRSIAVLRAIEFQQRVTTQELLAVVRARESQDLRDLARKYYGTQAQWQELARFNGLSSSRLAANQVVLVPRLQTAGA